MKYAIIECSNGNFVIKAEYSDLNGAKVAYHDRCRIMWNAPDVVTAEVMIANEQLECVEGYREFIRRDVVEGE